LCYANDLRNSMMQQLDIQHDKRIKHLIPENKISNKSKNPAPGCDERTAKLWINRLEMSCEFLLDRTYAYITHIFGLTLVHDRYVYSSYSRTYTFLNQFRVFWYRSFLFLFLA
jgi:hypothetical protein